MAYGHAERVLAVIRLLDAETAELLGSLPQLDAEQSRWLEEARGARLTGLRASGEGVIRWLPLAIEGRGRRLGT